MYEKYIEELEDIVEELEDKNLHNKAWKDFYADENIKLRKVNEQLQNNWNELKKGIEDVLKTTCEKWGRNYANEFDLGCLEIEMTMNIYGEILSKIQELEQGKDE